MHLNQSKYIVDIKIKSTYSRLRVGHNGVPYAGHRVLNARRRIEPVPVEPRHYLRQVLRQLRTGLHCYRVETERRPCVYTFNNTNN